MSSVYPSADAPKVVEAVEPHACAERIIAAREADPKATKASVAGTVLRGSDDVRGYYRVWDEVEAERIAMASVRAVDCATKTAYVSALGVGAEHLDPELYADGAIAASGSSTWAEFKEKLAPAEMEL